MIEHKMPEQSKKLLDLMKRVRRDIGNLLFHFTRTPDKPVSIQKSDGRTWTMLPSPAWVLNKILNEGKLIGTSGWTYGYNCVCFTEAPIQEMNSIFSLNEIASSQEERPRYEPYGVAVTKNWLFNRGGRPVIYEHPKAFEEFPDGLKYRFAKYDPENGIDYTWEREWRIKKELLQLDPNETLIIVPTAEEAFKIVYDFAEIEHDWEDEEPINMYHESKWLAVSLDLFGFNYNPK